MWHPHSRVAVESPKLSAFQDGHLAKVKIADITIKKISLKDMVASK